MGGPAPFGIDEEEALEKFESLWSAFEDARVSATRYSGSLGWKSNGGRTYLVHTTNPLRGQSAADALAGPPLRGDRAG